VFILNSPTLKCFLKLSIFLDALFLNNHNLKIIVIEQLLLGIVHFTANVHNSDVVATITFETETWLNFRDKTETS